MNKNIKSIYKTYILLSYESINICTAFLLEINI